MHGLLESCCGRSFFPSKKSRCSVSGGPFPDIRALQFFRCTLPGGPRRSRQLPRGRFFVLGRFLTVPGPGKGLPRPKMAENRLLQFFWSVGSLGREEGASGKMQGERRDQGGGRDEERGAASSEFAAMWDVSWQSPGDISRVSSTPSWSLLLASRGVSCGLLGASWGPLGGS